MHFAHFSALLLLAGTVVATPRHPWKGKWEHFHHDSSFASLEDASAGFTMPFGTGTAPVVPQSTVLAAPSKALVSRVPSVSSTESGGDDTGTEAGNSEEISGLPYSSAPAKAVSSTPASAAAASKPAPTTPASSSSDGGVTYSATFTEYVFLYPNLLHSFPPLPTSSNPLHLSIRPTDLPQVRTQRRQRLSQLQRRHRFLRLLQHPRVQRGRFPKSLRCVVGQNRHLRYLLATRPGVEPKCGRSQCTGRRDELNCGYGEQSLPGVE